MVMVAGLADATGGVSWEVSSGCFGVFVDVGQVP